MTSDYSDLGALTAFARSFSSGDLATNLMFEAAVAPTSREYSSLARQTRQLIASRDAVQRAQADVNNEGLSFEARKQALVATGRSEKDATDLMSRWDAGAKTELNLAFGNQLSGMDASLEKNYDRLVAQEVADTGDVAITGQRNMFPQAIDSTRMKQARSYLGLDGAGAAQRPDPYQIMPLLPNGDALVFNPNTGQLINAGNFPDAVGKQVMQDRNGDLIAVNPYTGERDTLVAGFGFPDVDPAEKFAFEKLSAAANVEQAMAGLDLQRRGMMINAIGTDLSHQIAIGRMTYDEAQLQLNRIDTAFTQRREERAQMMRFAVTRSSLRTNAAGETVTQLPFSSQLASILGAVTGKTFSETDFQLGVGAMNPDQTAQDVLGSSQFQSPIPALAGALSSSRQMIESILGKPMGNMAASEQITQMALPAGSQ